MPLRSQRSVSFLESSQKKENQDNQCVLWSYKKLAEPTGELYKPPNKAGLPRSKSVPTRSVGSTPARCSTEGRRSLNDLQPLPYHTVPLSRHKPKPPVKSRRVKALSKATLASISSPQPLDLHGIPNGLLDIDSAPTTDVPILRRHKNSSPVAASDKTKRNRRKGFVLDHDNNDSFAPTVEISGPVLISHQADVTNEDKMINISQLKLRTREEQDVVSKKFSSSIENLADANHYNKKQNPEKLKKPKPKSVQMLKDAETGRNGRQSNKMADKIQRTIRALYDGNLPRRQSFEKLTDDEEYSDEADLLGSSPKPEKKSAKKSRSPKTIRRAQVPIKDVDGSRRFKWRGSVNRIVRKFGQGQTLMQGQTFDVHLEDCPPSVANECVPYVVDLCCRLVEERGLSFTGIYRVPGNSGTLVNLQEELNIKGPDSIDPETDERFHELNVVSSLLKSFFRKLPDPLFTNELYDDFITMNRKKDSEERLNGLRRLIHMLPAPHYETLKYLIFHLRKIAENADVNKMEVRNLAIVFGPTLVRSTLSDNMATMVTDMSDQCRIVESVLQHSDSFFTGDHEEIPTFVRSFHV